jgi:hypothetical protein
MTLKHLLKMAFGPVRHRLGLGGETRFGRRHPAARHGAADRRQRPAARQLPGQLLRRRHRRDQAKRLFGLWSFADAGQSAQLRPDRPHPDVLAGGRLDPRPADGLRRRPDHRHHHAGAGPVVAAEVAAARSIRPRSWRQATSRRATARGHCRGSSGSTGSRSATRSLARPNVPMPTRRRHSFICMEPIRTSW